MGLKIGQYAVQERLKEDKVYKASLGGKQYILKKLREESELDILFKARHPSIPQLEDLITNSKGTYLVLPYIEGLTVADFFCADIPMQEGEICATGEQIASALRYMHEKLEHVHNEVTYTNIILNPKRAYLIDFEGARNINWDKYHKRCVRTTTGFRSIEQLALKNTPSSDVFGLGVCLYVALTSSFPYMSANDLEKISSLWERGEQYDAFSYEMECLTRRPAKPKASAPVADLLLAMIDPLASHRPTMKEVEEQFASAQRVKAA
jgi:serine/threonine protein kinase